MNMPTPKDAETILKEFESQFQQDKTGERVSGYLLAPGGENHVKIALPGDVASFIRSALTSYAMHLAGKLPEKSETMGEAIQRKNPGSFVSWEYDSPIEMREDYKIHGRNEGIASCRVAILKEAGIEPGVKGE